MCGSLHGYSAVLLNRDDSGLAKRMTYGDAIRTRISSQCLKRHWRVADGPHALRTIDGATAAVRSRGTVTRRVIGPLTDAGHDPKAIDAIEAAFQRAVYGSGKGETSRQPLLLGEPEVAYLAAQARELADAQYFTVVDDLQRIEDEPGADHIGETELTSGLFYGYVVVDRRMLLDNLGQDADLAGEVVERLVRLIATVSPGAKLGSTAPYGYAAWMLVEAGDCQPRSLAEAFRDPCQPSVEAAEREAQEHLQKLDAAYATGEARRVMSLNGKSMPLAEPLDLSELARWAGLAIRTGAA